MTRLGVEYVQFGVAIVAQVVALASYAVTSSRGPAPWWRSKLGVWFFLLGLLVIVWVGRGFFSPVHNLATGNLAFLAGVDALFLLEAWIFAVDLPNEIRARRAERAHAGE